MKYLLVLAALLAACAGPGAIRPGESQAQVVARLGSPADDIALDADRRQWVYPTGPLGTETYMVFVRAGVVEQVAQALTDEQFARIQPGTTTAEDLRRMIGPPYRKVRFDNLGQVAWDYRFRDTWGYLADFSAMVDARGIVASKVTVRLDAGRDRSGR